MSDNTKYKTVTFNPKIMLDPKGAPLGTLAKVPPGRKEGKSDISQILKTVGSTSEITTNITLTWERYTPDEWGANLSIDGYTIERDIILANVNEKEVYEYNQEYSEIGPGWHFFDGECYHSELNVDGVSEFERLIQNEINDKLDQLRKA